VLLKKRTLVGLAALALAGGAALAATTPTANAATIRCGGACTTLFSQKFGASDVVALGPSSTGVLSAFWYTTSEDFYVQAVGTVNDLYRVGVIAKAVNNTYAQDVVYQLEWAPGSHLSGKCLSAASGSSAVTLSTCGQAAGTLWVGLSGLQGSSNYIPMMNAALSTKSAMLLTATTATGPLTVTQMNLTSSTSNGVTTTTVSQYQMWQALQGAYGASTPDRLG
jgi:hypothetical protein